MHPGPRNLITDVPGVLVGNAQDPRYRTGTTVLTSDTPFTAAVQVMGGAPGTRETDLLSPDNTVAAVDALVLSGGSAFGLDAASGVMGALREAGRGFAVHGHRVPIVPAAILFDLAGGGTADWTDSPYPALGRAAFLAAGADFALGTAGAATGATTQGLKGGLGSASLVLPSGLTVGALVAVNAIGSVTMGDSAHFWAAPFEMGAEFGGLGPAPGAQVPQLPRPKDLHSATTIAIIATDADLTKSQARRVATAAQDGMARAIVPAHTPMDGDLVFAAATARHALPVTPVEVAQIGHAAALCLARAIARGVYLATSAPGDPMPSYRKKFGL